MLKKEPFYKTTTFYLALICTALLTLTIGIVSVLLNVIPLDTEASPCPCQTTSLTFTQQSIDLETG